jgi:hypothetical protein
MIEMMDSDTQVKSMPATVTFPTEMGVDKYFADDDDTKLECPVAYFAADCGISNFFDLWLGNFRNDHRYQQLLTAYQRIIPHVTFTERTEGAVGPTMNGTVEQLNNKLPTSELRVLVYCAALAALGYVTGNREDSIALARTAGFSI